MKNFFFKGKGLLIITCVAFSSGKVQAQESDTLNKRAKIDFGIYNLNYLRDYEYFSPIEEGYTLFGTVVHPEINFHPSRSVFFKAGVFFQQNFGDDSIRMVPTFLLELKNKSNSFCFGSYRNEDLHGLIDPLWYTDHRITHNIENGFNLRQDFGWLKIDNWLNWKNAIQRGSHKQEEVIGGMSAEYFPLRSKTTIISVPVQAYLLHKGGQINEPDSLFHVTTFLNAAGGLRLQWINKSQSTFISNCSAEGFWVLSSDFSPFHQLPFNNGTGAWVKINARLKHGVSIWFAGWQGRQFISPEGNPLMQSVTAVYPLTVYTETERKLLFATIELDKKLAGNVSLNASANPYYDLNNSLFEYALMFHLRFALN